MNKDKIESFKRKLLREKQRLEIELKGMHDENVNSSYAPEEYAGDQNVEDHIGDAASNVFDRERDISLEENIKDMLGQVDEALARIEAGKYGHCTKCSKKIDEARLRAIPSADLCIDCKKEEERHR